MSEHHDEQGYPGLRGIEAIVEERGTEIGTPTDLDSDDPKNVGTKPESDQKCGCGLPEDHPRHRF